VNLNFIDVSVYVRHGAVSDGSCELATIDRWPMELFYCSVLIKYFSCRIVNMWNSLPSEVVNPPSLNSYERITLGMLN